MKKIFITLTIGALTAISAIPEAAAQDGLSKQVEVTRAYTPKVWRADKIAVEPDMTDTVRLRPEGDFRIAPTAWPGTFPLKKLTPANITTASYKPEHRFYLRAGLGYHLSSIVDFYYTPISDNRRTFGVFANHNGGFSRITTDLGIKADAVEVTTGGGIFGSRNFRNRRILTGDLFYEGRYASYYGSGDELDDEDVQAIETGAMPIPVRSISSKQFNFALNRRIDTYFLSKIGGGIGYGDTFGDLSRFNFHVGADLGYSHVRSLVQQADVDLRVRMAMMPHRNHGFDFSIAERGVIDASGANGMHAVAVTFSSRYLLRVNKLNVSAGFDARFIFNDYPSLHTDGSYGQRRGGFSPHLEAKYDVFGHSYGGAFGTAAYKSNSVWAGALVPFVSVTSQLLDGSYEFLSRRNPYIHVGEAGPTGTSTDLRVGIAGNVHNVFTYKLSGGVSWLRDSQVFVAEYDVNLSVNSTPGTYRAIYSPVMFSPLGVRGRLYTVGIQLGLLPVGGFSASLGANWNRFDTRDKIYTHEHPDGLSVPTDLPDFDVTASLSYSYKGLFSISTAAKLIGDRHFLNIYWIYPPSVPEYEKSRIDHIKPVVDLSVKVEVLVIRQLWIFAEAGNLVGNRRYPFVHYPGGRQNVMAGVKVIF